MTGPDWDMEEIVKADVILMGSFIDTEEANDIDLIFVYRTDKFNLIKILKNDLAEEIFKTFHIPVHYTTLSWGEYGEMEELRLEKNCVLFDLWGKGGSIGARINMK